MFTKHLTAFPYEIRAFIIIFGGQSLCDGISISQLDQRDGIYFTVCGIQERQSNVYVLREASCAHP